MKKEAKCFLTPEPTARAIYLRADQLERIWQRANLAPDFRDRMIDAVFRQLERTSRQDWQGERIQSDSRAACRLLNRFWTRNARRDCARRRGIVLPIDENLMDHRDQLETLHDAHTIRKIIEWLVSRGERREVAVAFILSHLGLDSGTIARHLNRTRRARFTPGMVRQWRRRRFAAMKARLRTCPGLFSTTAPQQRAQPSPEPATDPIG